MTTENLKAVLTEEELGRVSHVTMIAEGVRSENPKTFSGCIVSFFYHTVLEIVSIISRLADEVVRLRDTPNNNDKFYMDGHSAGLAENENRVKELESKLEAWEDAEKIKLNKICGFGRCVFCGSTPSTTPGTYHMKPTEADDEVV